MPSTVAAGTRHCPLREHLNGNAYGAAADRPSAGTHPLPFWPSDFDRRRPARKTRLRCATARWARKLFQTVLAAAR